MFLCLTNMLKFRFYMLCHFDVTVIRKQSNYQNKPTYNCINCIFPLLASGMAALDSKASGKMGMRAVIYYMTTTFIAVFIGIIIVLIIHPGKGSKDEFGKQQKIEQVSPADAFLDLIRYRESQTIKSLSF